MISSELLQKYDWKKAIAQLAIPDCSSALVLFNQLLRDALNEANQEAEEVYRFFARLFSLHWHLGLPPDLQLKPLMEFSNNRSFIPEDLTSEELAVLQEIAPTVEFPHLRARFYHIIWQRTKDYKAALNAASSYFQVAQLTESNDNWVDFVEAIWLASLLAKSLRKSGEDLLQEICQYIEKTIAKWEGLEKGYGVLKLIEILMVCPDPDFKKLAAISSGIAANTDSNKAVERGYWELAATCHQKCGNMEESRNCNVRAAKTYEDMAKTYASGLNPSYMAACCELEKAIVAFRRIEGCSKHARELVDVLVKYEQLTSPEMKHFEYSCDVSEVVDKVRSTIRNMPLDKAVRVLCFDSACRIPSRSRLLAEAERLVKDFPILHLFGAKLVDAYGRVVAKRPGAINKDERGWELLLDAQSKQSWALDAQFRVNCFIIPAVQEIILTNVITEDSFIELVKHNPFIPSGHEPLFAKGLYYGFSYRFVEAAHILTPQLENSIRYVLAQQGITVIKHNNMGIQDVFTLDVLLREDRFTGKLKELFGEDVIFELESLLVSPFGYNYRNKIAHGLTSYIEAMSYPAVLIWWHVMRFCLMPMINVQSAEYEESIEESCAENVNEISEEYT